MWCDRGQEYFDFHGAYATLNQGHCHPRLVSALAEQAARLTLVSPALAHDQLPAFSEKLGALFGYQRVIALNTGTEACETAVKYARRWGYRHKGVAAGEALVVVPSGTYSGHSFAALSASTDESLRRGFGPFLPGFVTVPYGDASALATALAHPRVVGFLAEPIQGEAGIVLPPQGYWRAASRLCRENNVLFIADEIQTGLGRTGRWLASHHEEVRPDMVILGKALSGGMLPVSAILCSAEIGDAVGFDEHSSTFAGNPLACRVAVAALAVVEEERLAEAAEARGAQFRQAVLGWKLPWIKEVRGLGLLQCVEIHEGADFLVGALTRALVHQGVLALPLGPRALRFSPPLVIDELQMRSALERIAQAFAPFPR